MKTSEKEKLDADFERLTRTIEGLAQAEIKKIKQASDALRQQANNF